MNDFPFVLHRRAVLGYNSLTPEERDAVIAAIAPLRDLPPDGWPAAGAIRLDSPEPLYLVKIDDSLRAFVQPTADGRPEIQDFVRRETLELFFKNAPRLARQA